LANSSFNPKVSIVIPVYNGSDYLHEAVNSALAQTYPDIEILVINDGSSDGGATENIALSYGERIRYFSKPNGGVASALNMGIENMAGEYFSWLSHDDLYFEQKVERQIDFLSAISPEERNKVIVYSDYANFTNSPDEVALRKMPGVSPGEFRYWLTVENILHGCTLLIPKTAFSRIGKFNTQLRTTQDYDLWFRLAREYQFIHLSECLVKSRVHPNQGSITMAAAGSIEKETLLTGMVLDLSLDELRSSFKDDVAVAYAEIAKSMWRRGFNQTAWQSARLSLKHLSLTSFNAAIRAVNLLARQIFEVYIYDPTLAFARRVVRKLFLRS
jgi:glycosyltransferase involved in cell wall biosynthesis